MFYPAIFVALEVSKALASESVLFFCQDRQLPFPKSIVTLVPEIGKAIICLLFLAKIPKLKYAYLFIAHSMLFFLNNSLYVILLQYSSSSTIQFWTHVKLPITAFMHHLFIKKQTDRKPWLSLMMIFLGVVLTQLDDNLEIGSTMVLFVCILLAINSATAAIYNELLLKSLNLPFWEQQAWVAILSVLWNSIYLVIEVGSISYYNPLSHASDNTMFLLNLSSVVALATVIGLVTGFLVKKFDNIIKLVSSAISTILIGIFSSLLFPNRVTASPYFAFGSSLIVVFTAVFAKSTSVKATTSYQPFGEDAANISDDSNIRKMLGMIIALLAIGWITFYSLY